MPPNPYKRVKVCGLKRPEDVNLAVSCGADYLGFVLAPSPRQVSIAEVDGLSADLPAHVLTVAVVVNPSQAEADRVLDSVDRIQFHGNEDPDFCRRYGRRACKAFRIREVQDLERLTAYEGSVGAFLLDSYRQGQMGGTGHQFAWEYLEGKTFPLPCFLAGGINVENLPEALRVNSCFALDLSSGLESEPGVKSPQMIKDFFSLLKERR